jgi:hypothetical protein
MSIINKMNPEPTPITFDERSQNPNATPTDPGSFIKADIRNYENRMADSSDEFFSDYASSSYPNYRTNMNQMQRDMSSLDDLSSNILNNDIFLNCVNNLLMVEGVNDSDMIQFLKTNSIKNYKPEHFSYISSKVSKFLSLGPEDYLTCLQKIPGSQDIICKGGIISLSLYYVGQLFQFFGTNLDTSQIEPNSNEYKNFKQLYDIFLNNVNAMVKKTIDISKYFEQKYCDQKLSTNTLMADMLYQKVFTSNANVEYKLFDNVDVKLGFLDQLRDTFLGQMALLLFLLIISWKILSLFK